MKKASLLKAFAIVALSAASITVSAQSKLDNQILMTIGDKPVTVKEFTDVYNKNNLKGDVVEKKTVDEYLELFVNFRMKVMEAQEMQLDTSAKFKRELEGYRKQLAKPYFTNDQVSEDLIEEAYQRKLKDIRASHILVKCDKHALPSDTLKAYNKAMDIRAKALKKGADFGQLAATYSEDPSARDMKATETTPARKGNKGDLGYFTVFDMVYPFETGAYNTKEGEISMPVRSDFGYHIIKVTSVTDAIGTTQAAHIFIQVPQDASAEVVKAASDKADNIYKELMEQNGKNWNEAVNKYTDDRGTVTRSGALSAFTVSRIVPEFIEAVKQLQPEEISKPVRTNFGFHIIKLISTSKIGTLEKERQGISDRIEKDMRSKKSEEVVLQQIKSDYGFKRNDHNIETFMTSVDSTIIGEHFVAAENTDLTAPVITIGDATFTVGDFVEYIQAKQTPQRYVTPATYAYQLFELFESEKVLDYADQHLEEKYPDFKTLVQEYNDGILLFDLMEKEVWNKAVEDTTGLQEFYARHAENYMWKDRVKACVITVTHPESLPIVKDYLAQGVEFDSLRNVLVRDSVNFVYVRNGFYQKGDNQFVDETEWKAGTMKEIPSTVDKSTVLVNIIEVRKPEPKTLREAKGLVTSDYQVELEEKWMQRLHEKYPYVVDKVVLDKVRKLYK